MSTPRNGDRALALAIGVVAALTLLAVRCTLSIPEEVTMPDNVTADAASAMFAALLDPENRTYNDYEIIPIPQPGSPGRVRCYRAINRDGLVGINVNEVEAAYLATVHRYPAAAPHVQWLADRERELRRSQRCDSND